MHALSLWNRHGLLPSAFCFLLTAFCSSAGGEMRPRVVNAEIQTRPASAGLDGEFRSLVAAQVKPAWIGYAVPMVAGHHHMCCYESVNQFRRTAGCCSRCHLEGDDDNGTYSNDSEWDGRVNLESLGHLLVLFRVELKKVDKIHTFSEDCELDAGGLPVYWLTGVRPEESVTLLASFVTSNPPGAKRRQEDDDEDDNDDGGLGSSALAALALHAAPQADEALAKFVSPRQPESLREKASFWLGAERGRRGYEVLRRLVHDDPSDRFREKAVFALYVSREPEAVEEIIRVARGDSSSGVRGQALFWLGQKAGKKAEQAITDAIERDPETNVKKKAVFALSQLPKDEGVPMLIQVARTNRNLSVRKQAMFWLGQSNDPRALAFFEEVLLKQ